MRKLSYADLLAERDNLARDFHALTRVLQYLRRGDPPEAIERFSENGDRVVIHLYDSRGAMAGYVLIYEIPKGDKGHSYVREFEHWSAGIKALPYSETATLWKVAVERLEIARNRILRGDLAEAPAL
jgi:hypothetical protein